MIIEDEELRDLYRISGEERLQRLEAGLVQLEENPGNEAILRGLRREIHSLKGDSRSLGLDFVANLAQGIEDIFRSLEEPNPVLTPAMSNGLFTGLNAIERLIYEAVTGESSEVDVEEVFAVLAATIVPPASVSLSVASPPGSAPAMPLASTALTTAFIEDVELREIYRTTSEERLQRLEVDLAQLAQQPADETVLTNVLRQLHSLKGDSRSVGLETVEVLSHELETILKQVRSQELKFTSTVSNGISVGLATLKQFVHESVTGEPSGVDLNQILSCLNETIAAPAQPVAEVAEVAAVATVAEVAEITEIATPPPINSASVVATDVSGVSASGVSASGVIDAELREIYRTTSAERIQKLEAGLVHLENHPNDTAVLAELMREAHSLKGDSSSVGMEAVETLTHQFEEVLGAIQHQEIALTPTISDRLYDSLDAIRQLVRETVTREPSGVNPAQVLAHLVEAASLPVQASIQPAEQDLQPVSQAVLPPVPATPDETPQIETIRIQTRDLDALMSQADELAVTKIQTAQMMAQAEQIALLWQDWKTNRNRNPRLSPTVLTSPDEERLEQLINTLRITAQENQSKLDRVVGTLSDKIRTLRLLPLATVFQLFPRLVRDLAKQQAKSVRLSIEGGEITADKQILEGVKDALTHLIRNAIDHGIESPEERHQLQKSATATIALRGYSTDNGIIIEVTDDGRGLDLEQIKQTAIRRKLYQADELESMSTSQLQNLILTPGFSTRTLITEVSGRGVGLDVVRTMVERMKGRIQIESTPGQGCTFRLQLSTSLATLNVVLVDVQGILYALPFEVLQSTLLVSPEQLIPADDRDTILVDGQSIPVADLVDVLELSKSPAYAAIAQTESRPPDRRICVLLNVEDQQAGFFVDRLLDTQEVVIKPQSQLLKRVRNVMGATTLADGEICMILNPLELVQSLQQPTVSTVSIRSRSTLRRQSVILLVEDSPPVRIQEKRLFESAGYEVVIAVDGLEGYNTLRTRNFDAVVSDIEMPNLDGLSLAAKIRQRPEYDKLPIILVTTLSSDEDRRRGAEAGANAYITKGKFNQEILLETLERLV
jgi:two-component system, chemotaxis family, sensor kinase CheA